MCVGGRALWLQSFNHLRGHQRDTSRERGRKRRRETTTQNEMSNKEYENMRGRRASADGKWNKKAKKEQDRQARHQRSELIEEKTQQTKETWQTPSSPCPQPDTQAATVQSDYITFTTRQLIYMCPRTPGLLVWAPKLLFCQITLAGGQEEGTGPRLHRQRRFLQRMHKTG